MTILNIPDSFYPTPPELASRMLKDIDFLKISSVLEPSAGKGDLVKAIKEKESGARRGWTTSRIEIDCIESDANLRAILKSNFSNEEENVRIVHDDFLVFFSQKSYDLIIMNPPFENGDLHLLHALELQKNGGQIVCLLNAETIKNPYTNTRKLLVKKLNELEATIEYIKDAFKTAERKTEVEVALAKANIPITYSDSLLLKSMEKAKDEKEEECDVKDIVGAENPFAYLIAQFNNEVALGKKLIAEYKACAPYLKQHYGNEPYNGCILTLSVGTDRNTLQEINTNEFLRKVRIKYWRAAFNLPQFKDMLTSNLREEYGNLIEKMTDYDFSMFNIKQLLESVNERIIGGVEDAILSLFNKLTQEHSYYPECTKNIHYFNGWKTNKAHYINKKVIIPVWGVFAKNWLTDKLKDQIDASEAYKVLFDIEQALNYLDMGRTESIDLSMVLKNASNTYQSKNIDCKYFTVTFYKKGTCHIVFKSQELLDKLNIFGCQRKGWLPPCYGKKKYKDMSKEEQTVIDEFQGEKAYSKVFENKDYYLSETSNVLLLDASL